MHLMSKMRQNFKVHSLFHSHGLFLATAMVLNREGCNIVKEPDQCRNVSVIAQSYVKALQKFIESSELSVWDKKTNSGFWRLFTVS